MDRLSDFVEEHLRAGVNPAELKSHLMSNGWTESEVNNAIDSASGKKTKRKIFYAFIGIIIVAILALVLISMTKVSTPPPITPVTNNNAALGQTNSPDDCSNIDYSIEKNDCYKKLITAGLDCETIDDNIEFTYCSRAYENIMLKGVDETSENLT